jgi:2-oxoisovalerate dehydrogenase E1 component alpha subunit
MAMPSTSKEVAQTVKTKGPTFNPEWRFQEPVAWRDTDLDEKTLKQWFNYILLGRQVDYRFQVLNRQGRAPFIISCAGHEAAQIGIGWPLKPRYDWLAPYYRDVVLCMRMGMTPLDLMLSVLAKAADPASGGKQTPGHFSDSRLNITSGGSPVATQMVRGAGVAYALKMDGTDRVLLTCYGEGAGSEGDAHEAFNFAAVYKLPEIFVCENNGFAISTPFRKEYAIEHVAQRAAGYGFPGVTLDGRDPVTAYAVSKEAIARARAGDGPTLIE